MTAFGGPIAHIGYFRHEFVARRHWLDEPTYADLVALCQFLPGPASSQVAFSIGLLRAGYGGGMAAWTGFTLPSALLLTAFAYGSTRLEGPLWAGMLHGLELVAVMIVAHAVSGMARTLCPDRVRAGIAVASGLLALSDFSSVMKIGAIALGGIAGSTFCHSPVDSKLPLLVFQVSRPAGLGALVLFVALLIVLAILRTSLAYPVLGYLDAFYRTGALVFGGGHVVLPLLRDSVVTPGWVRDDAFLAGYGAAQAVPGPLFSIVAYLGAVIRPAYYGLPGAALALVAMFLPGLLILIGTLPFWERFRKHQGAQAAMRGINAAVVGLIAAALYTPLCTGAVKTAGDFCLALTGFVLMTAWRAPPILILILGACGGMAMTSATLP